MSLNEVQIQREICDPLYGYINISNIENSIIDSEAFQRLGRLYQTPTAHYIFPNATHTRKAHSLGVLYLVDVGMKRILIRQSEKIRENKKPLFYYPFIIGSKASLSKLDNLDDKMDVNHLHHLLQTSRIVGLCHDIGHGPFSHIFQEACKDMIDDKELKWELIPKIDTFKHEIMSSYIIYNEFKRYINDDCDRKLICDILLGECDDFNFVNSLIDGPYDVDKLDYVGRDSYHTGALEYGSVNYLRILDGLRVKDNKLLISSDVIESLVNTFFATQFMYLSVYYHKTTRIFDFMIYEAMRKIPEHISNIINDYNNFITIDDYSFILDIKNKRKKGKEYEDCYEIF